MSKFKATFIMSGFEKVLEMTGKPPVTLGFPIPIPSSELKNKTLSLYFRLYQFADDEATYLFDGWREM